ncbi:DUF4153 domain-containing protein [Spongiimicrobium salis]|uniref:DUF4153 domain-containing protein n=1 Tax=Spongiimicrobium salis TaxID=1667022 RepID=UPI00374D9F7B
MNIHLKAILSAIAFSLLFYSKSFGLNLFLIAIIVVAVLFSIKEKRPIPWIYALIYIFSALMVVVNPSSFQVTVHFIAFFVFVGKSVSNRSSLYIAALIGLVNMVLASVIRLGEASQNPPKTKTDSDNDTIPRTYVYLKGAIVALLLMGLFILMYRNANPIFNHLIAQIDMSFISVPWVFFTFLGYFLFRHLLAPFGAEELADQDLKISNELQAPTTPFTEVVLKKIQEEHILGSMVLGTLNVLLLFFLITDMIYLLGSSTLVSHAQYSEAVHEGVYALSFSVICAIIVLIYFFRGNLNFYKNNTRLKSLSFIWIGFNLLLVLFTCIKNYHYIAELGLTYKRIGVFAYLLLTLVGLITAYLKVIQIKSFMYLFRTNTTIIFAFLILCTAIPWDRAITAYNLSHLPHPDMEYLLSLNTNNSAQLYQYARQHKQEIPQHQKTRISERLATFKENQAAKSWQEYTVLEFTLKY